MESLVTINGTQLTVGQSMTLRVALTSFVHEMGQPNALGDDSSGRDIADGYHRRGSEVLQLMINGLPSHLPT